MFATQSLLVFVCLASSRSPFFSETSDAFDMEQAGEQKGTVISMKLPLMLQLLVQSHILFCSAVGGLGHYFEALSNLTDVSVLLHCCHSKATPKDGNLDHLFIAL